MAWVVKFHLLWTRSRPWPTRLLFFVALELFAPHLASAGDSIDPAQVRRWGAIRLADLWNWVGESYVQSVDGFTVSASPSGLLATPSRPVLVLVDGAPIETSVFGPTSLNHFPVGLGDLESVEFDRAPSLIEGRVSPAGVLRLTTKSQTAGPRVWARHVSGSETGDPGPFAWTPERTPNVERIGFQSEAGFAIPFWQRGARPARDTAVAEIDSTQHRREEAWIRGSLQRARHYASDPAVLPRLQELGGGDARVYEKVAPRGEVGWRGGAHDLRLFAHAASIEDAEPVESLLREELVERDFHEWGGQLALHQTRRHSFEARFVQSSRHEKSRPSSIGTPLQWRETESTARIAWTYDRAVSAVTWGGFVDRLRAGDEVRGEEQLAETSSGAFLEGTRKRASRRSRSFQIRWEDRARRGHWSWALEESFPWGRKSLVVFGLSRVTWNRRDAAPFLWAATAKERPFDDFPALPPIAFTDAEVSRASLTWNSTLSHEGRVRARFAADRFSDLAMSYPLRFAPSLSTIPQASAHAFDLSSSATVGSLVLTADSPANWPFVLRLETRHQAVFESSSGLAEVGRRTPSHTGWAILERGVSSGWLVAAGCRGQSKTEWTDEGEALPEEDVFPLRRRVVASHAAFDLHVEKSLAERRLHLGISLQNLFDADARSHPTGETEGRAIIVRAELDVGR